MFGNAENYSDLCWRKDCLGSARNSEKKRLTYLALSTTARKGESQQTCSERFSFQGFFVSPKT
nr:MAG TPA: hypothetical protein [Caudoviricetes sp.]